MKSESLVRRIGQWPIRLKTYVEELQNEMRRVTWPTWKQVRATTGVVIATVFGFAGYFFVVDLILGQSIGQVFSTFSR